MMEIGFDSSEFCLQENRPLRLRRARGLTVRCTAGILWITSHGENADIFLHAGESCHLTSNQLTLVESVGNGRVCLEMPTPPLTGSMRRLRYALNGIAGYAGSLRPESGSASTVQG
jgi:hypothetical protein